MKNILFTLFCVLTLASFTQAQVLFQEDFEGGSLPDDWSMISNASDGGWKVGTANSLSSQFWQVASNGSANIAATNDDECNCDKSNEYFITPPIDLSAVDAAILKADIFFGGGTYQGATEKASIEVSLDGINWQLMDDLHGHGSWDTHVINLSDFAGEDSVYIGFRYDDDGGWLFGFALDNVIIETPPLLDAEMVEVDGRPFGEVDSPLPIGGIIFNAGATMVTTMELGYSINGDLPTTETFDNLNIEPFSYFNFEIPAPWLPDAAGDYNVSVTILAVNGGDDENIDNNAASFETEIYDKVIPPNRIDEYLLTDPVFEEIAGAADQLDKPNDLDFFPIMGKDELWVVNERTENSGGSTVTIYGAGSEDPEFLQRVDGNAWHFMSLPTGIAFSDNFNFATSPGVKDANHSGGTFTGPTLWSSDPDIYAQPSGGNGSHLDMLHGSPFSMGIASETDNVFWVFDGWNETIVRYDFQDDHGPGNDDHSDAIVRRYTEIEVVRDGNVPSHLVLDKSSGWMYVVDNGNDRILRLDINSGTAATSLPMINEQLAEHSAMAGVTWEVVIQDSLDRPCGIELIENRLLVGDYATGDIIVYDTEGDFAELGRIATGEPGLTGIKIGPDGSIWYTNRLQNSLMRMEPGFISSSEEEMLAEVVKVSPNPTSGTLLIGLPELPVGTETTINLKNLQGKQLMSMQGNSTTIQVQLPDVPEGVYLLTINSDVFQTTRKIVVKH